MKRSYILTITTILFFMMVQSITGYLNHNDSIIVYFAITIISALSALGVLLTKKKVEIKVAWVIVIIFLPIFGLILYLMFGTHYNSFSKKEKREKSSFAINEFISTEKRDDSKIKERLDDKGDIVDLLNNINDYKISTSSKIEILNNGDVKYASLFKELEKAEYFINMEYFIVKEGIIYDQLKQILICKANEGVEIRILLDDFGCIDFPKRELKDLRSHGIKVALFNEIDFKLVRTSINYRNHRKSVIIDNKVGFTGGINIGDEYAHMDKYYGYWRDTHVLLRGEVVRDLNLVFIKDWYNITDELLLDDIMVKPFKVFSRRSSGLQIVTDGPDNDKDPIKNSYYKLINSANERVWIVTPYLILNNEYVQSLKIAAKSGVDVRIIIPGKHDKGKKMVYKATESYISELLEAGVKVYKYDNVFVHSKILIVDDEIASVGTVNLDYRSLDLHFELTVLIYFEKEIKELVKTYKDDLEKSNQIILSKWVNRGTIQKTLESLMRIFAPLL